MNMSSRTALLITLLVLCGVHVCRGDDKKAKPLPVKPPNEAELRAAITKSLEFLAKDGEQWMADKNCNSCHHTPLLLWGHREAKQRGFAVDAAKFDEWLAWSVERATDKKPGLEEVALMILALPERPAPELTKMLAAEQLADGTWKPAGQFANMQKRGASDARANSTRLSLLALAAAPEHEASHAKAGVVMQKKDAPTAMESLVFRTLFARRFGKPEEADALIKDILKRQRGDGGWSSLLGANMSDVLATGQALYVLPPASGDQSIADAIARAQHWLLKSQCEDGSWTTDITHISQIDRSSAAKAKSFKDATEIYHYWGSAWATIGLLQGVPVR